MPASQGDDNGPGWQHGISPRAEDQIWLVAYVQIDININITNVDAFQEYISHIPELINKHGGRYVVKGETPTVVEAADDVPQRSVILEFPDRGTVGAFFEERRAAGLLDLWQRSTNSQILVLDGYEN